MLFFIILILFCLPMVLLSFSSRNKSDEEEAIMVKLLYPLNDDTNTLKWLATFSIEDELFYIIVKCSNQHHENDEIEVVSTNQLTDIPVYIEKNN